MQFSAKGNVCFCESISLFLDKFLSAHLQIPKIKRSLRHITRVVHRAYWRLHRPPWKVREFSFMAHIYLPPGSDSTERLLRKIITGDRASLGYAYSAGVGDARILPNERIVTIGQTANDRDRAKRVRPKTRRKEKEPERASESHK